MFCPSAQLNHPPPARSKNNTLVWNTTQCTWTVVRHRNKSFPWSPWRHGCENERANSNCQTRRLVGALACPNAGMATTFAAPESRIWRRCCAFVRCWTSRRTICWSRIVRPHSRKENGGYRDLSRLVETYPSRTSNWQSIWWRPSARTAPDGRAVSQGLEDRGLAASQIVMASRSCRPAATQAARRLLIFSRPPANFWIDSALRHGPDFWESPPEFFGPPIQFFRPPPEMTVDGDRHARERSRPHPHATPGLLRMICQGRCVRQASRPQAAMVTIREGYAIPPTNPAVS